MKLIDRVWTCITYVLSCLSLSPFTELGGVEQAVLPPPSGHPNHGKPKGPSFKPPGGRLKGPGADFTCEYPSMTSYTFCSKPGNRSCWLTSPGFTYDINTNYETNTPQGIQRNYSFDVSDYWINGDGMNFTEAKVFNEQYPGPYIQACWGDTVTVTVTNRLRYNGTSIHWHGIRQWNTMQNDGVNGLTQCPIAPQDSFTYTFTAMQYGSSWYHSHYSVQYADGANGPLTLYGPNSANYDEGVDPILLTDWGHNSAFQAIQSELLYPTILLNGAGNITRYYGIPNTSVIPPIYRVKFVPKVSYLLRVINTSFNSTFVFSIDNHTLQVVEADFVPIKPYTAQSIHIGIGQRYHVIVTGIPTLTNSTSYWIRTYQANCFGFDQGIPQKGYERNGIVQYFNGGDPDQNSNTAQPFDPTCRDEPYGSLSPIYPWTVPRTPANDPIYRFGQNLSVNGEGAPTFYPLAFLALSGTGRFDPIRVDYGNPTFLNLGNTGPWNPIWTVLTEPYNSSNWVYFTISGHQHPIHLHGHDFAILQVSNQTFPTGFNPNLSNPPRRDVVLLPPSGGYVVIAYKTDNPGTWLMHCHIANHAAAGLALQFMEDEAQAQQFWPPGSPAIVAAQKTCYNWNQWWGRCTNWWPGDGSLCIYNDETTSPDSGI
ncbi:MAG: hypothetical protein M1813_008369 [Trichoglossum hirsutum]|nr:MAG: hypothetical protein M1813_008369 [Trichoglossum hirsutum]